MPERKSTRGSKPEKPYSEFPLTANGNGQWSKKIHGRVYYFGVWDDPDAALALYLKQRDYLLAGEVPPTEGGITLGELCNMFMASKEAQLEADEITRRHWVELQKSCQFMLDEFGKSRPVESLTPAHFANLKKVLSKGRNATTVSGHVRRIRSVFNWAASDDEAVIDRAPRFGKAFKQADSKTKRVLRSKRGKLLFTPEEIKAALAAATPNLAAMIYLGINAGLGNHDVGGLTFDAIDLKAFWLDYPRSKTGIDRRCPLWPETVAAINLAIEKRPEPKNNADESIVFISKQRVRYVRWIDGTDTPIDSVSRAMGKVLVAEKIKRPRVNFYTLRRTFQTIGEEIDLPAARSIMGHAEDPNDMSAVYRQGVSDERLLKVADHVRAWLFGEKTYKSPQSTQP